MPEWAKDISVPEVAQETIEESQELDTSAEESVEAPVTPAVDEATWKKKLAGKDQALTATQKERDQLKKDREALQRKVAEYEQANLSEVEKLQQAVQLAQQEAITARAEAQRERLARKFPRAAELLGDALPDDEVRLAEIEERLTPVAGTPEPQDSRIDPNSPRKSPPAPARAPTLDETKRALVEAGNPFYTGDTEWGGSIRGR